MQTSIKMRITHCFIENEAVIGNNVTIKNGVQTARIIEGIEAVLTGKPLNDGMSRDKSLNEPLALNDGCRYDGVIVYGDTNSMLAAAVAASKIHVPVFGADWAFEDFRAV